MLPETPNFDQRSPKLSKRDKIFLICLGVFTLIVLSGVISTVKSKHATYKADLAYSDGSAWAVINPSTVSVAFHVTNIGDAPGKPNCTVQAEDPSYTYKGVNVSQLGSTIQRGQTVTSAIPVIITKQGAQYVTRASVSCS